MSYQPKGLRSRRANPAPAGTGKKSPARRRALRQSTWARVLLIFGVVALPLLAAGLAGPAIRGGNGWRGAFTGEHWAGQNRAGIRNSADNNGSKARPPVGGRADFGRLNVTLFNPVTRCRLQADFDLKGVAVIEDGPALEKTIKNKYRFIREQATIAVRNCSSAELADPKLKLLERRVLIRINRSLEHPLLKSVDLAKFSLSESTPELDLTGKDVDAKK